MVKALTLISKLCPGYQLRGKILVRSTDITEKFIVLKNLENVNETIKRNQSSPTHQRALVLLKGLIFPTVFQIVSETVKIKTPFPHFPSLPFTNDGSFNILLPSLFA